MSKWLPTQPLDMSSGTAGGKVAVLFGFGNLSMLPQLRASSSKPELYQLISFSESLGSTLSMSHRACQERRRLKSRCTGSDLVGVIPEKSVSLGDFLEA